MRLIALLSWFDEPVESLAGCLKALADAGADHVVAVDGRYALYPADSDVSHPNEYATILLACRELGMGCTLDQPAGPWEGGEVEKRTHLFALGWQHAEPGDWFWVQDADQVTVRCPDDLKERLAAAEHDVAEIEMLDLLALKAQQENWPACFAMRSLFRAQPITVRTNHCTYVTDDGRLLWARDGGGRVEAALDLCDVVTVEHRPDRRPLERQQAKMVYYAQRDASGVERGDCELCGAPATEIMPARWRMTELGPVADWMECCADHVGEVDVENRTELLRLGVNPDSVVVENRNGRAPSALHA